MRTFVFDLMPNAPLTYAAIVVVLGATERQVHEGTRRCDYRSSRHDRAPALMSARAFHTDRGRPEAFVLQAVLTFHRYEVAVDSSATLPPTHGWHAATRERRFSCSRSSLPERVAVACEHRSAPDRLRERWVEDLHLETQPCL